MAGQSEPGRLTGAIPVLPSSDVEATLAFYRTKLGFEGTVFGGYLLMRRDDIGLHFAQSDDHDVAKAPMCRFDVRGIDALHAEFDRAGALGRGGELTTEPWGMRQFAVIDDDGNCLVFQEPISQSGEGDGGGLVVRRGA
jgi:catechol 2,3-dioxygenase-like lactoylglutathione lyase family enzyme